jgi:hypothetical protein
MSDYFFYDLNKKMADLADKQQLRESAVPAPVPKSKLTEAAADYSAKKAAAGKDIGKPGKNFSKIAAGAAKKYGSAEAGKRVAGAVLNKLRHPTEESVDESAFQAAIGKKKYGDQGMKALQKAGRNHASDSTMKKIRNQYDKYDESATDEGNAFSKAVVDAKRDGIQRGEKIRVGGKQYPVREQGVAEALDPDTQRLEQEVRDALANGDDYTAKSLVKMAQTAADRNYLRKIIRQEMYGTGPGQGGIMEGDDGQVVFSGTGANGGKYKIIQTGPTDFMIHANGKHIDTYSSLQRAMSVLKNEVPGLTKGVAEAGPTMAPMSPDGATAPPAKGADGQYPIVTSGPNKGKRWSPNTPGPTNPAVKEAAKYRAPKYKDILYTQEPSDYTFGPDMDDAYYNPKPDDYAGRKRKISGGSGDPLTRGFRMSADKSINTHGKRKGMPSRDQITSLKGSIKDVLGKHTEPNLPEGGVPMTPKQKRFAELAPPVDKITFADRIVGAKKEVDEMLGDVAANAMKKAVRGRNRSMEEESSLYDTPTRRKSSSGGEIDTAEPGVTRHRAGKSYSGAGHDVGADDDTPRSGQAGRRKVGAGMGTKIGAKINTGKSKLMTREGDMDPADQGEYDQEGEMAKDSIQTVVRHAMALEKILGDNDNLPEWVQSKLAKIESMMTAVDDYMQNQQDDEMKMDEESTNKRDNRAERAGRRVAKDIEYDEKKKDGIHGQRRGSEDSKAERAGRKVTKDIEYDEKKDKTNSGGKARKKSFEEESTDTRDSHAEKAGKKVAKDIEYDEKEKDGIHGQRRGSEDDKAERAGRKVTKDIEYDEKKDKKKEVDETTSSGSVATGGSAPKSGGGVSYGKGIYDSFNREVEKMISESMSINMSMNNDSHGGPAQTLTVTATDEDAMQLAMLLKSAGIGSQDHGDDIHSMTDNDSEMYAIHDMDSDHGDETCSACGSSDCECDEMNEAYGDTDATDNEPDYPTDEVGTDDAMMYSGGLNGPKSTGQTTIPVISGQHDRMGHNSDHELRRMMEIAGISR